MHLTPPPPLTSVSSGAVYVPDIGNAVIRRVAVNGIITTVAGTGVQGVSPDGGPALSTMFTAPTYIYINGSNPYPTAYYVADKNNNAVYKIALSSTGISGVVKVFAGTPGNNGYSGDGGPATSAVLWRPSSIAFDPFGSGVAYIADNFNNVIRAVDANGIISTVAGVAGRQGYNGDIKAAPTAYLNLPTMALPSPTVPGAFFIVDKYNGRIRLVYQNVITTYRYRKYTRTTYLVSPPPWSHHLFAQSVSRPKKMLIFWLPANKMYLEQNRCLSIKKDVTSLLGGRRGCHIFSSRVTS